MYEFGENLMKSGVNTDGPLAVGSSMRLTLTRMTSTPITANQNLAMILGNLTQQHRKLERTQSAPAPRPPSAPPPSTLPATRPSCVDRSKSSACASMATSASSRTACPSCAAWPAIPSTKPSCAEPITRWDSALTDRAVISSTTKRRRCSRKVLRSPPALLWLRRGHVRQLSVLRCRWIVPVHRAV